MRLKIRLWLRVSPVILFLFETRWYCHSEMLAAAAWPENSDRTYPNEVIQRMSESHGPPLLYSLLPKDRRITPFCRVHHMNSVRRSLGPQTARSSRNNSNPVDLSALLRNSRATDASDPRDKVYAFLGLFATHEDSFHGNRILNLRPNYLRSTAEVYTDAARFILHTRGDLKLLSHIQIRSCTGTPDMPPWIPDYSVIGSPSTLDIEGSTWSASGSLTRQHPTIPDSRLLMVQGSLVGSVGVVETDPKLLLASTVKFAAQKSGNIREENPCSRPVAILVQKGEAQTPICSTRPSTVELLWRTLIADRLSERQPAPFRCGFTFGDMMTNLLYVEFWDSRTIIGLCNQPGTGLLDENRLDTWIYLSWRT